MLITADLFLAKYQKQIQKNIISLVAKHSITLHELSLKTGLPYSTVHVLANRNTNPSLETITKIAKLFKVSIGQIVGDVPFTDSKELSNLKINPVIEFTEVLDFLANKIEDVDLNKSQILSLCNKETSNMAFCIKSDDKLEPTFPRGTAMLFDPLSSDIKELNDRYIIVSTKDSDVSLKKLLIDSGNYYLKSINNDIPPQQLTKNNKIIAVMIQFKKDF